MNTRAIRLSRTAATVGGAALLLASLIALVVAAFAPAKAADVLGGGKAPSPSCPTPKKDPPSRKVCQVVASVTAFQTTANGKRPRYRVPSDGHIVAWSIDLSRPNKEEQETLINGFDFGKPAARLAVVKQQSKSKFKLTKQSPIVQLSKFLGEEPVFTLNKPLRVKKGTVVALTTKSWTSNFAHEGKLTNEGDKWRASRSRRKCGDDPTKTSQENEDDLLESKPHRKVGSSRTYGCTYTRSRVLYRAYFVPSK